MVQHVHRPAFLICSLERGTVNHVECELILPDHLLDVHESVTCYHCVYVIALSVTMHVAFSLQISTNGLFSFSEPENQSVPSPFPLEDIYIVAPFWSDVDTRRDGRVLYEVHQWSNPSSRSLLTEVSSFLSEQAGVNINGTWMLVAEWEAVHPFPHGSDEPPSDFLVQFICI